MTHIKRTFFILAAYVIAALILGMVTESAAAETGEQTDGIFAEQAGFSEQNLWDPFFQNTTVNSGFPIFDGFVSPTDSFWPDIDPTDYENWEGLMDLNGDGKIDMNDLALLEPDEEMMNAIGEYLRLISGDAGCSIGDYVWFDADKDGIQDPDEPGVNGVTVELYNWTLDRVKVAETVTTAHSGKDGWYSFYNLPCGLYRVKFLLDSSKYEFTLRDSGWDDAADSDADARDGTSPWKLHATYLNKDDSKVDAGVIPKTGGVPASVFYSAGGGLILMGTLGVASPWIARRRKTAAKRP